jgi:hypothetical protein
LFHAGWFGHEEFIAALLEGGADPNLQNLKRNTCMHLAVERGHDSIVRLLLRHGADPLLTNVNGDAPFQVLPSPKEQLQWASFLFITLEAIWKKANPGWVLPEIEREDATTNAASGALSSEASPALSRAVTFNDGTKAGAAESAADALTNSSGSNGGAVDNSDVTPVQLDDSADHSALGVLSPMTPAWLSELSTIFQKRDASRAHTKLLAARVMHMVSSTMRMRHAVSKSRELSLAATTQLADSGSSGNLKEGTGSASGAGLANLLRNLKAKDRRSLGAMSNASGQDSGKSSARESLNVSDAMPAAAGAATSPDAPARRRRLSNDVGAAGAAASRSPSPSGVHPAAGSSRRRSNEGAPSASSHSRRRSIEGARVGAAAALRAGGRKDKTTAAAAGTNATPEKRRADKSPAADKDKSSSSSSSSVPTKRRSAASSASPATSPTSPDASAAASAAAASDAVLPSTDDNASSAAEEPASVPMLQYKLELAPAPAAPVVAAQVKTFSIFSASLQDLDDAPKKREADFSFWKQ